MIFLKVMMLVFAFVLTALAGEIVILKDNSRLYSKGHENQGDMVRLLTPGGATLMNPEMIVRFEPERMQVPQAPPLDHNMLLAAAVPPPRPSPPPSKPRNDYRQMIRDAARRHGIEHAIVKSIVAAESGFNTEAVSPRGAIGLMQVMPATAQELGFDASIPEENIEAGTTYLRMLYERYSHFRDGLKRAIAAYNAGPGAVDRYRGVPPYPETRSYVARVLEFLRIFRKEGK